MRHLNIIASLRSARLVAPAVLILAIGPMGATEVALGDGGAPGAYDFSYSGQLVKANGIPHSGTAELEIAFFRGESLDPVDSPVRRTVELKQGTFHLTKLGLDDGQKGAIFGGDKPTFIQIKDVTDSGNPKTYARQRITAVPYAMRVPVDDETVGFNEDGKLSLMDAAVNKAIDDKLKANDSPSLRKADFSNNGLLSKNNSGSWETVPVDIAASKNSIVQRDNGMIATKGLKIESGSKAVTLTYVGTSSYTLQLPTGAPSAFYTTPIPNAADRILLSNANGDLSWAKPVIADQTASLGATTLDSAEVINDLLVAGNLSVTTINDAQPVVSEEPLKVWRAKISINTTDAAVEGTNARSCRVLYSSVNFVIDNKSAQLLLAEDDDCKATLGDSFKSSDNKICNCTVVSTSGTSHRCSFRPFVEYMVVKTNLEGEGFANTVAKEGEAHIICYTGG